MEDEKFEKSENGKCSSFFAKFGEDFRNKENWKLKAVYFFLLSGIVILWVQLTIHQSSLNFSDRDVANFVSMSTTVPMLIPFLTGVVADKMGNFSKLVAFLMIMLGITAFCFTLVKPVKFLNTECEMNQLKTLQEAIHLASEATSLSDRTKCIDNHKKIPLSDKVDHDVNCEAFRDLKDAIFGNCSSLPNKTRDPSSYTKTYWIYFAVYASFTTLTGASYSLFDGTVMALQQEKSTDYGLQRAWGSLAALLSSYIGGKLVDVYSVGLETKDFTLMFYSSGVCFIIAGLITFSINISFKLPATNFSKVLWKDFQKFEMIVLLILIVFKGVLMAYVETFMYLFMSKLGASSSLIGLTVTVGALVEIGLQLLATNLSKYFGNIAVISIGILCYSIRFVGFSYTYNPVVMVYLEAFDGWASGLTLTAIVMYCSVLSSPSTVASMRGLISILHDGIGRLIGAKIGIEIKDTFGDRTSWRIMALVALLVAVAYFVTVKLYRRFRKKKFSGTATINYECQSRDDIPEGETTPKNCHTNPAFQI